MSETPTDPRHVITDDQAAFTPAQLSALRNLGMIADRKQDTDLLFRVAKTYKLDPFTAEVVMVGRHGRFVVQVAITGLRKIIDGLAAGTTYGIIDQFWEDAHGTRYDAWPPPSEGPEAGDLTYAPTVARVAVDVAGVQHQGIAAYSEYVAMNADGTIADRWEENPGMWLRNIAEALAWRAAFPVDLELIYLNEELRQADQWEPHRKGRKDTYGNMRTASAPKQ